MAIETDSRAAADRARAEAAALAAEGAVGGSLRDETKVFRDETLALKGQTETFKSETQSLRDEAESYSESASQSASAASNSAINSTNSASNADASRVLAEAAAAESLANVGVNPNYISYVKNVLPSSSGAVNGTLGAYFTDNGFIKVEWSGSAWVEKGFGLALEDPIYNDQLDTLYVRRYNGGSWYLEPTTGLITARRFAGNTSTDDRLFVLVYNSVSYTIRDSEGDSLTLNIPNGNAILYLDPTAVGFDPNNITLNDIIVATGTTAPAGKVPIAWVAWRSGINSKVVRYQREYDIIQDVAEISDKNTKLFDTKLLAGQELFTIAGEFINASGVVFANANFSRTDKIGVYGISKIRITVVSGSTGTCFYDKNDNLLVGYLASAFTGSSTLTPVDMEVPLGAEYMIHSASNAVMTDGFYLSKLRFNDIGRRLYPARTFNISDRNLNTYAGSMNTVIDALLAVKPTAKFVFISNFSEDLSGGANGKNIIDIQRMVADYWLADFLDLSKKLGLIYRDGADILGNYISDYTHPGIDAANGYRVVNLIARYCKQFLEPIFDTWTGKKIAWYGTSIPAGFPDENVDAAQYPKVVASLLGCTCNNYAQSSSIVRSNKVDGSPATRPSFTNPANSVANYITHMVDLIGTPDEPDLFVFDHGRNDWVEDPTDFYLERWSNKYSL